MRLSARVGKLEAQEAQRREQVWARNDAAVRAGMARLTDDELERLERPDPHNLTEAQAAIIDAWWGRLTPQEQQAWAEVSGAVK